MHLVQSRSLVCWCKIPGLWLGIQHCCLACHEATSQRPQVSTLQGLRGLNTTAQHSDDLLKCASSTSRILWRIYCECGSDRIVVLSSAEGLIDVALVEVVDCLVVSFASCWSQSSTFGFGALSLIGTSTPASVVSACGFGGVGTLP